MRIVPVRLWNHPQSADTAEGSVVPPTNPLLAKVMGERRSQFRQPQDRDSRFLDRIASESRVIIVEGISGSGKDTLQAYLKKMLKNRDVHDYSEGELLHSWKQFQIEGILELRVKFMKLFVNYVRDVVGRDENAVFLLNRFHLSTYAWTIIQQQKLGREYDEIINVLRMLPVHVLILQVDENEIEKRSLHPERSSAWQKFQQQIVENYGFCDRLEKQQKLILEAARRQQIPYSVIKLPPYEPEIGDGQVGISKASSILRRGVRTNSADTRTSRRKRRSPQTVHEDN
jgi:thymidylate kinase